MKIKLILFISLVSALFCQCENDATSDGIYKETLIKGTVYYQDNLLETPEKKAPETQIFLHQKSITGPYLYGAKSDANSDFEFKYELQNQTNYHIRGELKVNDLVYKGSIIKDKNTDLKLVLNPEYPINTLKIKLTLSSQPFYNAKVYLFTNQELIGIYKDATIKDIKGNIAVDSSNARGVVLFKNLNNDTGNMYYILVKYSVGTVEYIQKDSISLSNILTTSKEISFTKQQFLLP